MDITTTGGRAPNEADLRALDSSTVTVMDSNNQSMTVLGTTIETPPAQDMGGGLNTSLVAALPAPLGANNSVVVQLVLESEAATKDRTFVVVDRTPGRQFLRFIEERAKERNEHELTEGGKQVRGRFNIVGLIKVAPLGIRLAMAGKIPPLFLKPVPKVDEIRTIFETLEAPTL